ncbi:MAG TPA: Wzz/FepE/Etk N-terminal domain-containing protein [Anaerolineae bacterium]|nr:Wzz/FepE/Etk N-terminal domain-containing protein [Anaerolineae bacterium]
MQLNDYLRILRRRGWLIIFLGLLTAGAAFGFSRIQQPVYQSTVKILITTRPDFGQTQTAKALLRDYAEWLRSSYRAAAVIDELDMDRTPQSLLGDMSIAAASSESIITLEIKHSDPDRANDIARVWATQLIHWRQEENAGLRKEDRVNAELLDNPIAGLDSPQTKINTLAGAIFGALLGVVIIFLLEWIESGVIRRNEDIERYLDLPVIGSIPQ